MWYVYDRETTQILKTCSSHKTATAWRTRKHNEFLRGVPFVSNNGPLFDWGCADSQYFHQFIERNRFVRNLMTGKEVELRANTPRSCDPSSELYWTM